MNVLSTVGPTRRGLMQEGQSSPPTLEFSGTIIEQEHLEALEYWYDRRVLLELTDDLGRTFQGIFTSFTPTRERRAYNPWYHKWSGTFAVWTYVNASGVEVYSGTRPAKMGPNKLANPSFEEPVVSVMTTGFPTAWIEGNPDQPMEQVQYGPQAGAPEGNQAVVLYNADGGLNSFLLQVVPVVPGSYVTATGFYRLEGAELSPAFWDRGLVLSVTEFDETNPRGAPGNRAQANAPITASTALNEWRRVETRVRVPQDMSQPVCQVRLYAPGTTAEGESMRTLWDDIALIGI